MMIVMTGTQMIPTRNIPAKFHLDLSIYRDNGPLALQFFIVAMVIISSVDGRLGT